MKNTSFMDGLEPVIQAMLKMQRRDFLRLSGAALASSTVGVASALPVGVKFMDTTEAAVFTRLAQIALPVQGSILVPWTEDGLLQTLDAALLAGMEPHILAGLKGGIQYFNEGPVATHQKRFTALADADAIAFCDAWGNSSLPPQRGLAMGLKKLVQLSYWANPATWAPLGYDGPISKRLGLKSLGNAPMPTR